MKATTIHLEFVTPCFLGGADNQGSVEWRAASIRGQLRWWFRAVAGTDLGHVRSLERELFGSTEQASNVVIRAVPLGEPPIAKGTARRFGRRCGENELATCWRDESLETKRRLRLGVGASNPVQYLGYGCIDHHGEFVRPAIAPGPHSEASFSLWTRRSVSDEDLSLLKKALWAWLNLGGIGAKSRKGFGSLRCVRVEGDGLGDARCLSPASLEDLQDSAKKLLRVDRPAETTPPDWSRFSSMARIYHGRDEKPMETWDEAITRVGAWLIAFRRRYGSPGDGRTYNGKPVANRDYAWASTRAPAGAPPAGIPDRAGFGLPLPFGKRGETVIWATDEGAKEKGDARRASPLLIHVARFGDDDYVPILTHLPARLLPEGARPAFKNHNRTYAESSEQQSIVQTFLADLVGKKLIEVLWP